MSSYRSIPHEGSSKHEWRRSRQGGRDTSIAFWLTVLVVSGITLTGVAWGAGALLAQKGSERALRVERLFPKLKSSHGDRKDEKDEKDKAVRISEKDPSEPPAPKDRMTPAPTSGAPMPVPAPPTGTVVSMEHPPADVCQEPAIYLCRRTSQSGDTPMMRNWKTITMFSLLSTAAVALIPPPAALLADDKTKKEAVEVKGLDELQKSINTLLERIDRLEKKKAPTVEDLTEAVRTEIRTEIKKAQESLNSNLEAIRQVQLSHKRDIDRLADEVSTLRKKLTDAEGTIAKLGPTKERISGGAPLNGASKSGHLVLVNLYNEDLLFIVNGAAHRVPAGRSKIMDVPAGMLHYRVFADRWGQIANQSTTLGPGDTFTLSAARQALLAPSGIGN